MSYISFVCDIKELMKSLQATDSVAQVDGPWGSIQWAPDNAYAQAHGSKPEYAGRVRDISKNILPRWGNSRSYYTPSQARAQNLRSSAAMSEMIERAIEAEREQHRVQMAREREDITAQVTAQVTAEVSAQVAKQVAEQMAQMAEQMQAQMAEQAKQMREYEAKMCQLIEGSSRVVTSEPEVTNIMALAPVIYRSSVDSRSGNDILFLFLIS
jgi:Flp pilus assembly secretin CpaC